MIVPMRQRDSGSNLNYTRHPEQLRRDVPAGLRKYRGLALDTESEAQRVG